MAAKAKLEEMEEREKEEVGTEGMEEVNGKTSMRDNFGGLTNSKEKRRNTKVGYTRC